MNCLANTLPIWVTMTADCCTTIDPSCEDDDDADDGDDDDTDDDGGSGWKVHRGSSWYLV